MDRTDPMQNNETPLHAACRKGHEEIVRTILERSTEFDAYSTQGITPLMLAATHGHEATVKLLVQTGCPLESRRREPASGYELREEFDINNQVTFRTTALFLAAQNGRLEVLRFLVSQNARLNTQSNHRFTPLIAATYQDHKSCVQFLLSHGAQVDAATDEEFTALIYSALKGSVDIAEVLLDANADLEAPKSGGVTALLEAAFAGHSHFVEFCLQRQAVSTIKAYAFPAFPGITVVHLAVMKGSLATVKALVRGGVDLNIVDDRGWRPVDMAREWNRQEIVNLLKNAANAM